MTQRPHLVFGGDLKDPGGTDFRDVNDIHFAGMFSSCMDAYDRWKAKAYRTADSAHRRCFNAHRHRLCEARREASSTEERGG